MVAYGNRQNALMFARANNCDLLQTLKHLMETRLNTLTPMPEIIRGVVFSPDPRAETIRVHSFTLVTPTSGLTAIAKLSP